MKLKLMLRFCAVLAVVFVAMMPAYADAIFTLGNHPQPDEQNIIFKTDQTGILVYGFTETTDNMVVVFSGAGNLVVKAGQDTITAQSGLLQNVVIESVFNQPFWLKGFIVNPFNPTLGHDLSVTAWLNDGKAYAYSYGTPNADNFLTATAINNELISYFQITAGSGFESLTAQVSGITFAPEPSALSLMSGGLLTLAGMLRRKKSV